MLYYLGVVSLIIFLSIFGLFFLPIFGGCFILIISLAVLVSLIVFLSINFIWFLFAGTIIYVFTIARRYSQWKKLPDQNQYMQDHSECVLTNGMKCCHCGSEDLNNKGLFVNDGKLRYYQCKTCRVKLFRTRIL